MTALRLTTPLGAMMAELDADGAVRQLVFAARSQASGGGSGESGGSRLAGELRPPAARELARQLDEYFAGRRRAFEVQLAASGTEFERCVWDALRAIPYGETRSYGELARDLAAPGGARAVGRAAARNPIAVVVPCHRLVGAGGALTGYAGGLDVKRRLLELEGALPPSLL